MRRIVAGLLLAVLIFSMPGSTFVSAGEGEKELKKKDFPLNSGWGLLEPILGIISGPLYLKAKGLDPSSINFGEMQGDGLTYQAAGLMGLVPYRSPAPAASRNLLVTRDLGIPIQTEPHIAVNPKDPNHAVISAIEYAMPYNSAYVTIDGGATWQGPRPVTLNRKTLWAGDPTVAFNREGKVFSAFMGIGEEETYRISHERINLMFSVPVSNISVGYSKNGGLDWEEAVVASKSSFLINLEPDELGRFRGIFAFNFLDKPWMSIGPDPLNPANDVIYVTYTEFIEIFELIYIGELPVFNFVFLESSIKMISSKNGGENWSEPQDITPLVEGFTKEGTIEKLRFRVVQGSQPAVAPDGTLHVAWYDSTKDGSGEGKGEIYVRTSKDGQNFGAPVLAAEFLEGAHRPRTASFRNPSYFPQMAAGKGKEIYIVFASETKGKLTDDGDIYFVRSVDGVTFEKPKKLNQDKTNRLQFFPAIAVDPKGNLHAMWGDMRDDPTGLKYHIYYTQSLDRGATWGFELPEKGIREPDTRVTDFPSNPNKGFPRGRFIGDYYAIAASEKDVYLVWTDARLGEYGGTNQKIGFARRRAIASPEVFLNPPKGPGGQEVTLQAFNFQPEMNIYIRMGGNIISAGRTNGEGRITYKLFIPVAGEGTHDIAVFDDSGNTALGSFYMDFGFGDIKSSLNKLQAEPSRIAAENQGIADEVRGLRNLVWIILISMAILATAFGIISRRKKRNQA